MAEANPGSRGKDARPLSPHLQIYSMQINMLMSIVHRITGAGLYFGTLILVWWLVAAATGPAYFNYVNGLLGTIPGQIVLFGFTWALMHHTLGGLRHLIWDTGRGFQISSVNAISWLTLIGSLAITGAIWAFVLKQRGLF